jgi:phospholipid/cholesterol/gamma-HCH transport system substrate-binding protein
MSENRRTLELGTGLFVLLGFAALAFLSMQLPGSAMQIHRSSASYKVTAYFDDVGDLKAGAPVTMAGVRIGEVTSVTVNPADFKAVATLAIDKHYQQIPEDSYAAIETSGLLGAKYIGLDPGGAATFLTEGSQIQNTQSALVLEKLINKFFANLASKKDDDEKN